MPAVTRRRRHPSTSLSSLSSEREEAPGTDYADCHTTPVRHFAISKAELNLKAVLQCGQTFRWNQSKLQLSQNIQVQPKTQASQTANIQSELVEWSVAWIDRTIVLRQDDHGIHYVAIYRPSDLNKYQNDLKIDTTYQILKDYFVLDVSLVKLYQEWSRRDPHFSSKVASGRWDGLRVCRQDSWETMISFICSANNNIPRISLMLNRLCASFGEPMPRPPAGITLCNDEKKEHIQLSESSSPNEMYSFPSPCRLSQPDILEKLKLLGFGYRAGYVYKTARKMCEIRDEAKMGSRWPGFEPDPTDQSAIKPDTQDDALLLRSSFERPENYLNFLANQTYQVAHTKLVTQFPGIGQKVADCICLFGFGFVHAVPVDVHIYRIASRDYRLDISQPKKNKSHQLSSSNSVIQNSASTSTSPKKPSTKRKKSKPTDDHSTNNNVNEAIQTSLVVNNPTTLSKLNYLKIQNFFVDLWGPWAGWAQQILFLADLNKPPT